MAPGPKKPPWRAASIFLPALDSARRERDAAAKGVGMADLPVDDAVTRPGVMARRWQFFDQPRGVLLIAATEFWEEDFLELPRRSSARL